MRSSWHFILCARQGAHPESERLSWAEITGTTHLSQGVCREAGSEGADGEWWD
jgi:hypothetical protein